MLWMVFSWLITADKYIDIHICTTLSVFVSGSGVAPWPPAPPGDRLWQILTFSRNPNLEPSSYPYTSTEWFSDMPTNFGLPPVRCSQWHKKNGYLDRLKGVGDIYSSTKDHWHNSNSSFEQWNKVAFTVTVVILHAAMGGHLWWCLLQPFVIAKIRPYSHYQTIITVCIR